MNNKNLLIVDANQIAKKYNPDKWALCIDKILFTQYAKRIAHSYL
jgi:hypothetical protein